MAYGQEEQLPQETHYEVMVDESTGAATVSFTLSREEVERRIREVERDAEDSSDDIQEISFPIRKIWWCVRCQGSSPGVSVKAYTEIDAGFGTCGFQAFSVRRGKC
jgi:hypothetical protein